MIRPLRPRTPPNIASTLPIIVGVVACLALLMAFHRSNSPEGEQPASNDYQLNQTLALWTARAANNHGQVTLTSKEIHDLSLLSRDSCR